MRDRLIELIVDARNEYYDFSDDMHEKGLPVGESSEEYIADHLIANGVLVPPCKVGDDIWWVDEEKGDIACEKGGIQAVVYNGKTFEVLTEAGVEPIGTKFCNLSRKEAEAKLKGGEE